MRTGTKSLLFGVHQFIWHPFTVYLSWICLYKTIPTIKQAFCIMFHDWGYWGKLNMDDEEGENHPYIGAKIAQFLFKDEKYYNLCLLHSRHLSRNLKQEPSLLCWADKYSIRFEPEWFYLFRARLSGELKEYRKISIKTGFMNMQCTDSDWFKWIKKRQTKIGIEKKANIVTYANKERTDNENK